MQIPEIMVLEIDDNAHTHTEQLLDVNLHPDGKCLKARAATHARTQEIDTEKSVNDSGRSTKVMLHCAVEGSLVFVSSPSSSSSFNDELTVN